MPQTITWYLVRHGETAWNAENRYQGQTDEPLTDTGREQSRALKKGMTAIDINFATCSDLSRARETGEIILENRGISIRADPRLRELNYGEFEGLTGDEIRSRAGSGTRSWHNGSPDTKAPGGECFADLHARVGEVVASLRAEVKAGNVMIVAHGGTLRSLVLHLMGLLVTEFRKFRFSSASVTVIRETDGQPALWAGDVTPEGR